MCIALAKSIETNDFRPAFRTNAVKLVVLITDAPPSGFCDSSADPYDTSYESYAHNYALEAATNHIQINAILVTGDHFESDARTVQQDYAATTCGWYPPELNYGSSSDDIETDILYMLYNLGECGSP